MGKPRILGNNAVIYVQDRAGALIPVGEIDKFSAKKADELKKSQPLGDKWPTSQTVHRGWELSFEGGKVDWQLASLLHAQDQQIQGGSNPAAGGATTAYGVGRSPYFKVKQTITFFDGTMESWLWEEVSIHGYEIDIPTEELTEKFSGFCGKDRIAAGDMTGTVLPTQATTVAGILSAMNENLKNYNAGA